jgi:Leucine-rich repeat (LRR) protein
MDIILDLSGGKVKPPLKAETFGTNAVQITEVDISENELQDISAAFQLTRLKTLNAATNKLSSLPESLACVGLASLGEFSMFVKRN